MPMPPYSSGMSTEVNPSSAALRNSDSEHAPAPLPRWQRHEGENLLAGKLDCRSGNLALLLV